MLRLEAELMGRRGPKPAPTALKVAKGETRPSRVNVDEPALPAPSRLDPPDGLVGAGRAEWLRLAKTLSDSGVLTTGDLTIFEAYCRTLTDLATYEGKARKAGPELAIAKGYSGMVLKLRGQLRQLAQDCGLTPSSRSGVKATKPRADADDLRARFFGVAGGKS